MTDQVAFAPKVGVDNDALGVIFVNDTTEVNVRALVEDSSDGVFVVPGTSPAVRQLDAYEPLKRVAVPVHAPQDVPVGGAPVVSRAPKKQSGGGS
jgi:hypothetical protein